MPTPERIFENRKIVAKDNILPPSEIKFFCDRENLVMNPRIMKEVVEKAEKYLNEEIKVIPLSVYRRYVVDGNRREMEAYYFPRRSAVGKLFLAELYERKGRFTNKLIDNIWAILEESTWLLSAHFRSSIGAADGVPNFINGRMHDISLFAASTGALLSTIYKYGKDIIDQVSPYISERIKYEVTERIIKPYITKDFYWMGVNRPHRSNWLTWITSNVLVCGAVFADDKDIRERLVTRAMHSLDSFTLGYNADGGCDEGPSYWGAAAGSLLDSLDTLYDMSGGKIDIYDHPLIKAMGEYIVDFNIFDRNVVNFADAGPRGGCNAALLRRYGEVTKSEVMLSYANYMNRTSGEQTSESHSYRMMRSIFEPDATDEIPMAAKPAVYYDYIKAALIREKAVRGEGLFLAMKGGHNQENHNHNDMGGFMVYSDKTPVIVDLGPGEYINWSFATREKTWYKYSDFHSTPTFDGKMQKNGLKYCSKNEIFSAEEKAFTLDITDSYDEEAGLKAFVRRGEIKDGSVIITDKIELENESEIIFNFTLPAEPKVDGGRVYLSADKVLSANFDAEVYYEAHDTAYPGCKSWGETIWRACFKVRAKSGEFVFTIK